MTDPLALCRESCRNRGQHFSRTYTRVVRSWWNSKLCAGHKRSALPPKNAILVMFDSQDVPPRKSKRFEAHHHTPRSIRETLTLIFLWVTTTLLIHDSYEQPLPFRPLSSRCQNCRETTNISPSLPDMSAGLFESGTENQKIWVSDWKDLAFEGNGEHREIRMFVS